MNPFDTIALLAELADEKTICELNHGPDTECLKIPAVDYIMQPFGYTVNKIEDVSVREMVIPVCAECASALDGDEWVLIFCFECSANHWVYRQFAKMQYRHKLLWLRGCPECSGEFGGIYFGMEEVVRLMKEGA